MKKIPEDLAPYLNVGLYTFSDAGRLIGAKPSVLRRWAQEYRYQDRGVVRDHAPVIQRHFGPASSTLTFLELIELLFVKVFRAEGVSMQAIRRASERASSMFNTQYPFAVKRFDTDGKRIFATLKQEADDIELIEELGKGQFAFDHVVRPLFRKLDYGVADALRYWPLDHGGRVVLDPRRAFGKPIDDETGVPTEALYNAMRADGGQDPSIVAEWFEVPIEAVKAADRYETELREQRLLAA